MQAFCMQAIDWPVFCSTKQLGLAMFIDSWYYGFSGQITFQILGWQIGLRVACLAWRNIISHHSGDGS